MAENDGTGHRRKDAWDKWDTAAKVSIPVVVALVAGLFAYVQDTENRRSTETQFYTDLMAQRERADSELRQHMFTVLIDNYFHRKLGDEDAAVVPSASGDRPPSADADLPNGTEAALREIKRQVMFASLLARNFENVDIRPLFEELDRRLRGMIALARPLDPANIGETTLRRRAYILREELRRVAIGITSRQASSLGALRRPGMSQQGSSRVFNVGECSPESELLDGRFILDNWRDGEVRVRAIDPDDANLQVKAVQFNLTFYDMPILESLRLPNGSRVALTLYRYVSSRACRMFADEMDGDLRSDCAGLLSAQKDEDCDRLVLGVTDIPDWYIGPRDRPYVTDLISGRFSPSADPR